MIIVITNQSGIARGLLDEDILGRIHERMAKELAEFDARVDHIYFCVHHPDDDCDCRKPRTGLIEMAFKDHDIDPSASFMVGDHMLDVIAGTDAGLRSVLIPRDEGVMDERPLGMEGRPDHVCHGFLDGVEWIMAQAGK